MSFYSPNIVNYIPSCTVTEIVSFEYWCDYEIWVADHSVSLTMVPFESSDTLSYSHAMITMALSCIVSEIKRDIGLKSATDITLNC